MISKICTGCGIEKESTTGNFSKAKLGKHGLAAKCKSCVKKYNDGRAEYNRQRVLQWRQDNIEEVRKRARERSKTIYKDRIQMYYKKYRQEHKEELQSKNKDYRKKRRDHLIARSAEYRANNKHILKRWKQQNKDYINSYVRSRYKDPEVKAKYDMYKSVRYTRKKNLPANFTAEQWKKCKEYFNNCCAYCGNQTQRLAKDHFIALSKGGEFTVNNVVPACMSCNGSKMDRSFFEWYPNHNSYNKARERKILTYLSYKNKNQQLALTI